MSMDHLAVHYVDACARGVRRKMKGQHCHETI